MVCNGTHALLQVYSAERRCVADVSVTESETEPESDDGQVSRPFNLRQS